MLNDGALAAGIAVVTATMQLLVLSQETLHVGANMAQVVLALLKKIHSLRYTTARRAAGGDSMNRLDVGLPTTLNCCCDSQRAASTRKKVDCFRRAHVSQQRTWS